MLPVTRKSISEKSRKTLGLFPEARFKAYWQRFMAGFKTLVHLMMQEAREDCHRRMAAESSALGADAVICMRYACTLPHPFTQGAEEIIA